MQHLKYIWTKSARNRILRNLVKLVLLKKKRKERKVSLILNFHSIARLHLRWSKLTGRQRGCREGSRIENLPLP